MDSLTLLQHLIDAFSCMKNKRKKSQGTHIKEIQFFQTFFKTMYNPHNLSQTIYDVTFVLKKI